MDNKRRRYFVLYGDNGYMGHGTYYSEGNVQCYMSPNFTALQMQLADALHLDGVKSFTWVDEPPTNERDVYTDGIMYYCDKCEYIGVTTPPFETYHKFLEVNDE